MELSVVMITSMRDEDASVILVGFVTSCVKLKVVIKSRSWFASGQECRRLQLRSPSMTIAKFINIESTKLLHVAR